MKFKFEVDLSGPESEGDVFDRLQLAIMGVHSWIGSVEWRFDELRVPPVRLPLPTDELGRAEQPVMNRDGTAEIGVVGFFIENEPPPFKAPKR